MGYSTSQFENILVSTLDMHGKTAVDQIFNTIPTFKHLMMKGRVDNFKGPGDNYKHPLGYAVSPAAGWTSGYKTVDTSHNDFLGEVTYQFKNPYATVKYSYDEINKNRGEASLIKLAAAKIEQAKNTIRKNINTALHAASVATDAMESLATTVLDSGTLGGINSSTYTWWASTVTSCGSFASGGLEAMGTIINTLRNHLDGSGPDLIVTTQTVYQYYQKAVRAHSQNITTVKGDLGVPEIQFQGIPIIYDPNCASGVMYFINSKALKLAVDANNYMKATPMVKPYDQMAEVGQIYCRLQLVCLERRALGKLTGITA